MTVDSFKYLPRLIALIYELQEPELRIPIPWTSLPGPVSRCKFGLVTTGGLFHKSLEAPFDLARERAEPTWGDPTYRTIPLKISQEEVGVSHLHVNTSYAEADLNVLLPVQRFQELERQGIIGGLANNHYSFMGYQGYPPDTDAWRYKYGPQVAQKFLDEGVNCVLLTPS